ADDVLERFLRYVKIDTQAAYRTAKRPSTEKQLELSRLLVSELRELGLDDAELTESATVFATLPGTVEAPVVGLIAHVDTTPDVTGSGVSPIVHRAWGGDPIELPGDARQVLDPEQLPALAARRGHDIVTSDGTTLLGADDKAGIAEIMAAVAYLARRPERPRARVRVAFTVDEEVGRGAEDFDLDAFGADAAYTLDGSDLGELEVETFSAKSVRVTIHGLSVHPGTAKGKLVNAVKLASELVMSMPAGRLSPETTEGREGYVHPHRIAGNSEEAVVDFIARDHDEALLEEHVELLRGRAEDVTRREPRAHVEVEVRDSYRNMRPYIEENPRVVEAALEAIRRAGVDPRIAITRGGTDGAVLSARGLPTPNLFTGGQEYHSVREWASVQDMAVAAATIVELVGVWAEPA
ncbi:MAG: peptidase T, partial [Actinobacteria bacterium]|nr:peptidase T [Actinomycetota bacterium]